MFPALRRAAIPGSIPDRASAGPRPGPSRVGGSSPPAATTSGTSGATWGPETDGVPPPARRMAAAAGLQLIAHRGRPAPGFRVLSDVLGCGHRRRPRFLVRGLSQGVGWRPRADRGSATGLGRGRVQRPEPARGRRPDASAGRGLRPRPARHRPPAGPNSAGRVGARAGAPRPDSRKAAGCNSRPSPPGAAAGAGARSTGFCEAARPQAERPAEAGRLGHPRARISA
jgi:hypothetical protein